MQRIIEKSGEHKLIFSDDNTHNTLCIEDFSLENKELDLKIILQGRNSSVHVFGRATTSSSCKKRWNIELYFEGEDQKGVIDLKGIAYEFSSLEFHGGGVVKSSSCRAQVDIREKIVLFSPQAKAKATPILRVETEDIVSASHSAAIAPFDKEIFFFLESRGIDPLEGKKILQDGFLYLPS